MINLETWRLKARISTLMNLTSTKYKSQLSFGGKNCNNGDHYSGEVTWRACSATQSLSTTKEEESVAWDLDLDPFFLSSLEGSRREQAGSPASLTGVGTKSNTKPLSRFELSLPITSPTWELNRNERRRTETLSFRAIQQNMRSWREKERENLSRNCGLGETIFGKFEVRFLSNDRFHHCWKLEATPINLYSAKPTIRMNECIFYLSKKKKKIQSLRRNGWIRTTGGMGVRRLKTVNFSRFSCRTDHIGFLKVETEIKRYLTVLSSVNQTLISVQFRSVFYRFLVLIIRKMTSVNNQVIDIFNCIFDL